MLEEITSRSWLVLAESDATESEIEVYVLEDGFKNAEGGKNEVLNCN